MGPIDINGWEFIFLAVLAVFVLGPERLPDYAAKLARLVRRVRRMADGARSQLRDQLGDEFDEVDWRAYDPRQYDPRRIVREALANPDPEPVADQVAASTVASVSTAAAADEPLRPPVADVDPTRPTPWDAEAT
ncbi:MAG: preprotein translocase subunit TatA [Dermatophilaceae bacterium]